MSSSDRFPFLTATVLDQTLLDNCHDNLATQLEMSVDIETPSGTIRASDRNKYVGSTFYEALLNIPVIRRTLGEWLSGTLEFSTLVLELSNVDRRYSEFLPGGASFGGWIGKSIEVKFGLRDVAATYSTNYKGTVTPVGGFGRTVKSIRLKSRDDFDKVNKNIPKAVFRRADFPKIVDDVIGLGIPIIYGDWTTRLPRPAVVPSFPTNSKDPMVAFDIAQEVTITIASPGVFTTTEDHLFENDDKVELVTDGTLPSPLSADTTYYIVNKTAQTFELSNTMGGAAINTSGSQSGNHQIQARQTSSPATRRNLQLRTSNNSLSFFDSSNVFLRRGSIYVKFISSDIVNIDVNNKSFEIDQEGSTTVDGNPYTYETGDEFFVRVKGESLGGFDDNPVEQARQILKDFGGLTAGDFDANWDTFRSKASPAESAIVNVKTRVHRQTARPAIEEALSILEQVKLEAGIDRNQKFKINSLHFDDWPAPASIPFTIRNWDVVKDTWAPRIDTRNNFNRLQTVYGVMPDTGEQEFRTPIFRNESKITQDGREISKLIVSENLYIEADAINFNKEILKLASATFEIVDVELTWRSILKDIGDFAKVNVSIQSAEYSDAPAMFRSVGIDPSGFKNPAELWILQMVPYPGYSPGFTGITGGSTAVITEET